MCLVKKPKVVSAPVTSTEKEAAILRNPYLDGLAPIIKARQGGVKALTIRRQTGGVQTPGLPTLPTIPLTPTTGGNTGGNTGGSTGGSSGSDTLIGGTRQRDTLANLFIQKA